MSNDLLELNKLKINALVKFFTDLGYKTSTRIGRNEFTVFLNKKASTGRFDPILTEKLFEVLNLDAMSTLPIEDFVYGFIQFEEDLGKIAESFNIQLAHEQEIYNKYLKQCNEYQTEKLNAEGFCENAKIFGEITDIDIKQKLEGIKEIIIIVIYNEQKDELHFKIGDKNSSQMLKKSFSFKPTSRKDHFEFIMKGLNEKDEIFDIGSKVFPLDDINSQEEYLVHIEIPEMDKPDQILAFINTKIVLYMSDFKYYEELRRKQEKRLKKYIVAANKATEYLKYVREIYGDLSLMKSELIVDFNNEKLMQRKGAKLNVNFNNELETEAPGGNFFVEFNNEREIQTRETPLRVEFHNSKEVLNPITETKKVEYKYNYATNIDNSVINELEKKIAVLNKEKDDIIKRLQNLPKPKLEPEVNIKKTTNITIIKKQEQTDIPKVVNLSPEIQTNLKKIVKTTETKTQNISPPQINESTPSIKHNQISTQIETKNIQKKSQNISNPKITYPNVSQNNNAGEGGYIQKTTETTKTITTTPVYSGNQNQTKILYSVNGHQNGEEFIQGFLKGQNMDQYNVGNTTTTTSTTTYDQNNYNLSNINVNEQYENKGEIGYGVDSFGQVNEYEVNPNTIISNQVQANSLYNNTLFQQSTNKALVSENTLPVSYLPDKINNVIYDDKIKTLPIITTSNSITHNPIQLQPIIHGEQSYYGGEESDINGISNANNIFTATNNIDNNYGVDFTFNTGNGNFSVENGIVDSNNIGSYNYDNNNVITTEYNNNYNSPIEL